MAKRNSTGGKARGNGRVTRESGVRTISEDFVDTGPDGPAKQRKASNDDKNIGHNAPFEPDGDQLAEFLDAVEENDRAIEAIQHAQALRNEPDKKKIAGLRKKTAAAKEILVKAGMPSEELSVMIQQRRLRREADEAPERLNPEQKAKYAAMEAAFNDFADIPGGLGQAARAREAAH